MHAQLITYSIADGSLQQYKSEMVTPDAEYFHTLDTLVSKVWVADEDTNRFGGFYLWKSKKAMDDFMTSDVVRTVLARPYLSDVSSTDWPVNEIPSRRTRGIA